jgi:capsular polysaccharide biosynthesis protein
MGVTDLFSGRTKSADEEATDSGDVAQTATDDGTVEAASRHPVDVETVSTRMPAVTASAPAEAPMDYPVGQADAAVPVTPETPRRTLSNASRHRLRVALTSILAALVVGGVVGGIVFSRPAEYQASISLLAVPTAADAGDSSQYGAVVSYGLPALTELARSPSVLRTVSRTVPGSPAPDVLYQQITVEIVPTSGVARITVTAASAELAGNLAEALNRAVAADDILAPSATLRPVDEVADVTQTSPQVELGIGLALVAAVLAGLAVAVYFRPFRPRVNAGAAVLGALAQAGHRPVAVLDGRDPVLVNRLLVLQQTAARPLRVVPVGPGLGHRIDALEGTLSENQARLAVGSEAEHAAVVALMRRREGRPEDLAAAVASLPRRSALVAVVLE